MGRVADSIEALGLMLGAGSASADGDAARGVVYERHGLRHLIETTFGQLVGLLVAFWCILRSVDSLWGTGPPPDGAGYMPAARASLASTATPGARIGRGSEVAVPLAKAKTARRDKRVDDSLSQFVYSCKVSRGEGELSKRQGDASGVAACFLIIPLSVSCSALSHAPLRQC